MRIPDELLEVLANEYLTSINTKDITFEKYLLMNSELIKEYKKNNEKTIN